MTSISINFSGLGYLRSNSKGVDARGPLSRSTIRRNSHNTMARTLRNGPAFSDPSVTVEPIQFKLFNSGDVATAFPVFSAEDLPDSLVDYMHQEFNKNVDAGQTYPHMQLMNREEFIDYWLHSFCAVALKTDKLVIGPEWNDWEDRFLGTFFVKPNYLPRCSHNCNGGFLVNSLQRGQGIGYRLGQVYLNWAPLLGYTYSVFNLVFVTNVGSWKIWDKLAFDRIGYLPKAAILKGFEQPVDAIMFGKDLTNVEPRLLADLHV